MATLEVAIDKYVSENLRTFTAHKVRAAKIVHDTILGTNIFYPHEIAVLDLPILQRLRRISQVDVVSLVFPSGNHNRFEHTLGVTVIAGKLISALFEKINSDKSSTIYAKVKRTQEDILNHARMAGILHDCGHGPFSHMSEGIFKQCSDYKKFKEDNPQLAGVKPHEILSYLITKSDRLKEFFAENIVKNYNVNIDLDLVAEMIVGVPSKPELAFLIDTINGAFDADKLDYIQRDSHFTGVKLVLDLPRLFHTLDLIEDTEGRLRLSVDLSGVAPLEQIVFSKMMLYSSIYHHQKVRAAECIFSSIFDEIKLKKIKIDGRNFKSAVDFLYLTDDDIYSLYKRKVDSQVTKLVGYLIRRDLPKRAMVLSLKTINCNEKIVDVMKLCEKLKDSKGLREAIAEESEKLSGKKVSADEIWVDFPEPPTFKEGKDWPIKSTGEPHGYVRLRDVFPVDDWVRAFSQNKWRGYVYTRNGLRKVVFEGAKSVFQQIGIEVNDFANVLCKMEEDI